MFKLWIIDFVEVNSCFILSNKNIFWPLCPPPRLLFWCLRGPFSSASTSTSPPPIVFNWTRPSEWVHFTSPNKLRWRKTAPVITFHQRLWWVISTPRWNRAWNKKKTWLERDLRSGDVRWELEMKCLKYICLKFSFAPSLGLVAMPCLLLRPLEWFRTEDLGLILGLKGSTST